MFISFLEYYIQNWQYIRSRPAKKKKKKMQLGFVVKYIYMKMGLWAVLTLFCLFRFLWAFLGNLNNGLYSKKALSKMEFKRIFWFSVLIEESCRELIEIVPSIRFTDKNNERFVVAISAKTFCWNHSFFSIYFFRIISQ